MIVLLTGCALLVTGCGSGDDGKHNASPSPSSSVAPSAVAESPEPKKESGARLSPEQVPSALIEGQFDKVYAQMSEDFHKAISVEQLREGYVEFSADVKEWKREPQAELEGQLSYVWTDPQGRQALSMTFDDQGTILAMRLQPLKQFPDTDAVKTKRAYGLPFKGEWFVVWGGTNVLMNYHYEHESQRYAYDLVQAKNGASYEGDPARNESYYAYGQPILAPGDGIVARVVNDIKDNVPVGTFNTEHPAGNVVVIDHGDGEFSFLAHLQEGSVEVKVGDRVSQGDPIGLCGNSGNSSEAHLHFQVSDQPDLFEGKSIRIQWENELDPLRGTVVDGGQ
ncbi:peptidoglycan DD-metalloendopeptidase family protein [Cohnella boryungensis]|uniref:Peptidoglycan DD-metalloendopeptidase family protein n=1 Tax=Cohnella boryungensis TaxID=768479 RepID=A0ABV8S4I7_9BACL